MYLRQPEMMKSTLFLTFVPLSTTLWIGCRKTQDILEDYNETFKDPGQRTLMISSDRIDNDLFKGQKAEFDELFQILDRTAGHLRLKLHFIVSKM